VGSDPGSIDVNVIHGITDTLMSDVEWTVILADDIAYGESTDYVTFIPDGEFILVDPRPATVIAYNPPPFDPGDVITLLLSGFQDSVGNQNGPFFSVLAVFPDGQSIELVPFPVSTEPDESLPDTFSLRGNYPNPFNPSTTISFDLASPAGVSIEVFDVFGRRVLATGVSPFSAGVGQEFQVDASSLPSGTYLYRVLAEMNGVVRIQTGRMTLLK
ncbi:MAG: T9SS type A sorting domain-containing protein, partial [Bacteroidetes bacterium]|nr:T9SS type A sorting domain-containing protein [Bacteroidota bacterium]